MLRKLGNKRIKEAFVFFFAISDSILMLHLLNLTFIYKQQKNCLLIYFENICKKD